MSTAVEMLQCLVDSRMSTTLYDPLLADNSTEDVAFDCPRVGLSWVDVSLQVSVKKGLCGRSPLQVLSKVSGAVSPGQMLAIMGPSGAGKSSLLDVLAMRCNSGQISGTINIGGLQRTRSLVSDYCGYVTQDDCLLPNLTVRETLDYAAQLRLPGMPASQRKRRVEEVIASLGLRPCANTKIGTELSRGVSGGQRRRVSIGVQLLVNPSILFLDEPTSGLDSFSAFNLIKTLSHQAGAGRTVVFTIHQPRSDIYDLLDQVMILSGGRSVYNGPAQDLVSHLHFCGHPCPEYSNPADFALDLITVDYRSREAEEECKKRVENLIQTYDETDMPKMIEKRAEEMRLDSMPHPKQPHVVTSVLHGLGTYFVLVQRMWLDLGRDFGGLFQRLTQYLLFGLILVLFFGRLGHDEQSVQNRVGLCYEVSSAPIFLGAFNAIALFPNIRNVMLKERADNMYSAGAFFTALCTVDIPCDIVASLMFCVFSYWIIGLHASAVSFAWYCLVGFLLMFFGTGLGEALLMVMRDPTAASNLVSLFVSFSTVMASGFIRSAQHLPKVVKYVNFVAIQKYASQIVVYNEFKDQEFTCKPGNDGLCFKNGEEYLEKYFPNAEHDFYLNVGLLMGYVFLGRFVLFVILSLRRSR